MALGASEGSGWCPLTLTMSFGRLESVSGRDGCCLGCRTRLLSCIIELKVLYHVVTDKHAPCRVYPRLESTAAVHAPNFAEIDFLAFRVGRSKGISRIQPADEVAVLQMNKDETMAALSKEMVPRQRYRMYDSSPQKSAL